VGSRQKEERGEDRTSVRFRSLSARIGQITFERESTEGGKKNFNIGGHRLRQKKKNKGGNEKQIGKGEGLWVSRGTDDRRKEKIKERGFRIWDKSTPQHREQKNKG